MKSSSLDLIPLDCHEYHEDFSLRQSLCCISTGESKREIASSIERESLRDTSRRSSLRSVVNFIIGSKRIFKSVMLSSTSSRTSCSVDKRSSSSRRSTNSRWRRESSFSARCLATAPGFGASNSSSNSSYGGTSPSFQFCNL